MIDNQSSGQKEDNITRIPVNTVGAKEVTTILTGDSVKKMEDNQFKVAITTEEVEYIIPAEEVHIENVAKQLKVDKDNLKSIEVEVVIEKMDKTKLEEITKRAEAQDYEIIFSPVDFKVVAKTTSKTGKKEEITISQFNNYVERILEIPKGVDPSKITTGIVYNADGTFSHIPTEVFEKDGKYFAKLNSLTNSSNSVIWN